ncbi:MAG: phosphoserine phosphatase SerB, partial [Rhizomicrobium sp.]
MTQAFPFTYVLNVIAAHKEAAEEAAQLRAVLAQTGGVAEIEWLSPFHAFDIPFESNPHAALNEARALAERLPLDVNVLPAEGRRKKLLVADMDSTIINCECLDELADMAGIKAKVSAITERAMRGELDFAAALRERVAMLKGLSLSALHRVYAERIRLNPGAKTLVATMRKHGAHTLLVSGGFSYFTSRVARDGGFHSEQANDLLDDGTTLTGLVREPILGREAKLAALEKSAADMKVGVADALAVGDGANDLAMIQR